MSPKILPFKNKTLPLIETNVLLKMGKRSIILLLLLFSEYAFSQNQTAVSLEQQETLLQGYWAYSNSETDELFILKLKIFSRSPEHIYGNSGKSSPLCPA